jgi:cob(I)alamin adenosyltransferase
MPTDRIYSRGGDAGETSLADGSRVRKDSPRVEACGSLDEAASAIGLARAVVGDPTTSDLLAFAQQRLLNAAALVATPPDAITDETVRVKGEDTVVLERAIDRLDSGATGFVLPSGGEVSARLHLARTVVRRAERRVCAVDEPLALETRMFLNRLSDLLYVLARRSNATSATAEERWNPRADAPEP